MQRKKQIWTECEPWCVHIEDYVLFGSAEKLIGICSEEDLNSGLTSEFSTITMPLRMIREFLAKSSVTKMDHLLYSPDLAPLRFLALPNIKIA
jgi:hypothetical protein